jgi:Asp-tRNA(Asn)/Glu-tRNA(Gln) amidotransferase A subunit family amidase
MLGYIGRVYGFPLMSTFRTRLDSFGPMGKSTWDVAALLSGMNDQGVDHTAHLKCQDLDISKFRLGVLRDGFIPESPPEGVYPAVDAYLEALEKLRPAITVDNVQIDGLSGLWTSKEGKSWTWAFKHGEWMGFPDGLCVTIEQEKAFEDYLQGTTGSRINSIDEFVKWNDANPVCGKDCQS